MIEFGPIYHLRVRQDSVLKLYGHHKTARCPLERISQSSSFSVEKLQLLQSCTPLPDNEQQSEDIVNYARLGRTAVYFLRDSYPVAVLDGGKPFLLDKQFFGVESRRSCE